jgi:deoxyribose-phosphate aldolase
MKKSNNGIFIVFEGLDGSGQSTQAEKLESFLREKGFSVIKTKEPTVDSSAGRKIKKVLEEKEKISGLELQRLFTKDREEHLRKIILPNLKKGKIVISDRYFFSSFAYGFASGIAIGKLIKMNGRFPFPDCTLFLDVSPETSLKRIEKRNKGKTLFEKEKELKKAYKGYKKSFKFFENIHLINGEVSVDEVFEEIKEKLSKKLMKKTIPQFIDHTNISPDAKAKDIKKTCQEAKKYNFRSVCINPEWVKLSKKELEGTDIKVVVLIDPPMGLSSHKKRVSMCKKAKRDGADELDIVMNIVDFKYERFDKVLKDLKEISKILPTKVIIGSGFLTDEEVKKASEITKKAGAHCVKTATFKDPLEYSELKEKLKHVKIMKKSAPGLEIKASGNIKTLNDLKMMIKGGADIVGTSSGVKIMKEYLKKN